MQKSNKMFFGWTNIKWLIREMGAILSGHASYFSKKRIESAIAFFIGQFGMVYFLLLSVNKMDTYDICMWAAVEFAISGYIISQIQKQKKDDQEVSANNTVTEVTQEPVITSCPTCGQPMSS